MRTQNLHDTVYDICRESDKCYVRKCVYIHGNRTKKTRNGGHRKIKKGASTDPKKHFEVINFILGHFVNFLEEIYQQRFFDVSSPLRLKILGLVSHVTIITRMAT